MIKWNERGMDIVHDENNIKGFFGEYRWLSNFHVCPVMWNEFMFESSEAAYQAAKSLNPEVWAEFTKIEPKDAKSAGRKIEIREDWDEVKLKFMYDINLDKYWRNPELGEKLLATGDKYLEETNWWNDTFWGVCKGKGENHLGKTLMLIRKKLREDPWLSD